MVLPLRAYADELFPRYQLDGATRQLIDAFARNPDILVISPETSLQFRAPMVDARQLREQLGVDYVLSAHLVRCDQDLDVTLDLWRAGTGARVWREVMKAHISHLHDFNREVVAKVINSVLPGVRSTEIERAYSAGASSTTAYHYTMKALSLLGAINRQNLDEADGLLLAARSLDPTYAQAFAWGARIASLRVGQGWTQDRAATAELAQSLASRAISLDPDDAVALSTAGHLRSFLFQDFEDGWRLIQRALQACPNSAYAWSLAAPTLSYMGRAAEGRAHAEHAIWLSPMDPFMFQFLSFAGLSCYIQGDYEAAVSKLSLALDENPHYTSTLKYLIASLVGLGRVSEARGLRPQLLALEPGFGANGVVRFPFGNPAAVALLQIQMQTAGIGNGPPAAASVKCVA